MPLNIKVSSTALRHIQQGVDYYNLQQKGLENLVHDTLQKIQEFPFSASLALEGVRYKVLKKFPYIVLYETDEATIYVLRVFNTHQSPAKI